MKKFVVKYMDNSTEEIIAGEVENDGFVFTFYAIWEGNEHLPNIIVPMANVKILNQSAE